jgi:septal ring factor EnvC (AmiA/AmiB activator)
MSKRLSPEQLRVELDAVRQMTGSSAALADHIRAVETECDELSKELAETQLEVARLSALVDAMRFRSS